MATNKVWDKSPVNKKLCLLVCCATAAQWFYLCKVVWTAHVLYGKELISRETGLGLHFWTVTWWPNVSYVVLTIQPPSLALRTLWSGCLFDFKLFHFVLFSVCIRANVPCCVCRGQRTTFRGLLPRCGLWVQTQAIVFRGRCHYPLSHLNSPDLFVCLFICKFIYF